MKITTLVIGPMGNNCYVVEDEQTGTCAVIDPGFAPDHVYEEVQKLGLRVDAILLTHGHYDHVLGVARLKALTGARVVISRNDADCLMSAERCHLPFSGVEFVPVAADETVIDGDTVEVGNLTFAVLYTPGHTSGSICYRCENCLFSGDTLFYEECGRCDLPTGNYEQMLKSLARLARLPGDLTVYPGHGEESTLEHEREFNRYMKEGLQCY